MKQANRDTLSAEELLELLQRENAELRTENSRLRKMYPAWMDEFAVRYDAAGDRDGVKLGLPSLELRTALASMLPSSGILAAWRPWPAEGPHSIARLDMRSNLRALVVESKWGSWEASLYPTDFPRILRAEHTFNSQESAKVWCDAELIRRGLTPMEPAISVAAALERAT